MCNLFMEFVENNSYLLMQSNNFSHRKIPSWYRKKSAFCGFFSLSLVTVRANLLKKKVPLKESFVFIVCRFSIKKAALIKYYKYKVINILPLK